MLRNGRAVNAAIDSTSIKTFGAGPTRYGRSGMFYGIAKDTVEERVANESVLRTLKREDLEPLLP